MLYYVYRILSQFFFLSQFLKILFLKKIIMLSEKKKKKEYIL